MIDAIQPEIGDDGLAKSDWDLMYRGVTKAAEEAQRRAAKAPSISARQYAANLEAARKRVWRAWRRRVHGIGGEE